MGRKTIIVIYYTINVEIMNYGIVFALLMEKLMLLNIDKQGRG